MSETMPQPAAGDRTPPSACLPAGDTTASGLLPSGERHAAVQGLDLPVRRVTAYEDRAAFEREGPVTLPGGAVTFRVEAVSPLVSDAHLSAALVSGPPGAAVDDVLMERRWVAAEGVGPEAMVALERQLETAADARFSAEQALSRATERRTAAERDLGRFLEALSRAAWHTAAESGEAGTWRGGHALLQAALTGADAALHAARLELQARSEEEQRLQGLLASGRASRLVMEARLFVRLSGPAGPARLRIRGLYPCALWRPSHEAHLKRQPDGRPVVSWTTGATLWQRTGETWKDVAVTLSTARPGAGAELPGLAEDRLRIRDRVPKPKVVQVAHREVAAARPDLEAAAPGVFDGGEARTWELPEPLTLVPDGRPRAVALSRQELPATAGLCALPELSAGIFLRAVLRNGERPLLAGPVNLLRDGGFVGTGDLPYVGPGEAFELSFGTDDRFSLEYRQTTHVEERVLTRDRTIYVQEVELSSIAGAPEHLDVSLRLPVSELAGVKIVPHEKFCTDGLPLPDADGRVQLRVDLHPGRRRLLRLGFEIEAGSDMNVPPPW